MPRSIMTAAAIIALCSPCASQPVSSIVTEPTFNNIGITVTFSAAPDSAARLMVAWNTPTSAQPWRSGHDLSRVAPTVFAGSIFSLAPNSAYLVRLSGAVLPKDTTVTVTTRSDVFMQPQGTVHHVAVNGSDARDGSSAAQAFATLGKAISVANTGATILLHAGRYYESVTAARSGTAQAPICIRNAPGETAILDGSDTSFHPSWSVYDAAAGVYRCACSAEPRLAYRNGLHIFASPTLRDLIDDTWTMDEGFFADGSYLYLRLHNKRAPDNTDTIRIPRYTTGIMISGKQYLQIRGLEICYYGLDDYSKGIYFDGASYNLVDSCVLHHSGIGVAFKRACRSNTVQHCTFTEAPIDTWNWSAVKEGSGYYEAGGVIVYGSSAANTGNVIRFNRMVHMFDGSHLYSDDDAGPTASMDFHDNHLEYVNDDCIETDGAGSNCRIYNNTFRTFLTGVSVAPAAGGPTYIMRNTFSGWETHGEYVGYPVKFNVDSDMSTDWVYLYHNTCHTGVAGQPGFLFKQYSNWNNVISRNNIFAGTAYALESTSEENPVDFDYDGLYSTSSAKVARWEGKTYASLDAFSASTGLEPHGKNVNPEFTDAATGDFRLAAGSRLIDAGVVIAGVNDDYLGEHPDPGRYESGTQTVLDPKRRYGGKRFPISVTAGNLPGMVLIRIGPTHAGNNAALTLFDLTGKMNGRVALTAGNTFASASFRLGSGVYVLRVASEENNEVRRFVVR